MYDGHCQGRLSLSTKILFFNISGCDRNCGGVIVWCVGCSDGMDITQLVMNSANSFDHCVDFVDYENRWIGRNK